MILTHLVQFKFLKSAGGTVTIPPSPPDVEIDPLRIGGWEPWPARRRRVHVATGGLLCGRAAGIERRRRRTIESAGALSWGGEAKVETRRADPVVVALLALAIRQPDARQREELREMVLLLGDAVDLDELILLMAEECFPGETD